MSDDIDSIMDIVDAVTGEGDIVALIHAYFDESVDGGFVVLGAYVFRKPALAQFEKAWREMLRKYGLPYFRMSACNAERSPFDKLDESECDAVARQAIGLIDKYATLGFSVGCKIDDFEEVFGKNGAFRSPYEYLLIASLGFIKSWSMVNGHDKGISYFFEAGYSDQGIADTSINKIMALKMYREQFLYRSHAFVDKKSSIPTQAADILAWQVSKNIKRVAKDNLESRGDYIALTKGSVEHVLAFVPKWAMQEYNEKQQHRLGESWPLVSAQWRDSNSFGEFVRGVTGGVFPDALRHL